jgi:hypothetical protein
VHVVLVLPEAVGAQPALRGGLLRVELLVDLPLQEVVGLLDLLLSGLDVDFLRDRRVPGRTR